MNRAAAAEDRPRIGLVNAAERLDQSRFAGSIFADQAVDLAVTQDQGNVVVCYDRPECLADVPEFPGHEVRRMHDVPSVLRRPRSRASAAWRRRFSILLRASGKGAQ